MDYCWVFKESFIYARLISQSVLVITCEVLVRVDKGCFSKNSSGESQQQVGQRREHVFLLAQTLVSQRSPHSAALVGKTEEK